MIGHMILGACVAFARVFLARFLPDAVMLPENVVPEVLRLTGVMIELNVAFPVTELLMMFSIVAGINLVLAPWRLIEYLYSNIPVFGRGD